MLTVWGVQVGYSQVVNPDLPAQEDTVTQERPKKPDSLREKVYFRSIRFGTDILALILSGSDRFDGWEVNADADFGPFLLAVDYGHSARNEKWNLTGASSLANSGDYSNEGSYWRVGADVNILKRDPDRNMLFFGLRYARSTFSDQATLVNTDPYFGPQQYALSNPQATAVWGEMVAGLRVKIWKEFWMGFTSRMKIGLAVRGNETLSSYNVPGYGNVNSSTGYTWGFNYQVFWRIPFKRLKKPLDNP